MKILQYAKQPGTFPVTGIHSNGLEGIQFIKIETWEKDAFKAGLYYNAWITIINNSLDFRRIIISDNSFQQVFTSSHTILKGSSKHIDWQRSLESILNEIDTQKKVKNKGSNQSLFLLSPYTLANIFKAFNNHIFICDTDEDFCEVFNYNNCEAIQFKVLKLEQFYHLVHEAYEYRSSNFKYLNISKSDFLIKMFSMYKGNVKSSQNRRVKTSNSKENKKFVNDLVEILKNK